MRVLYLTQNPNRMSTNVPTEGWFRLLSAKGLEPVLISSQSGGFQEWARQQGVPCYDIPLPFPDRRRPLAFGTALASVLRVARRHRVELVHSNEQDVYPISQYAARVLSLPKVASVHFTMQRGFCEWAFGGRRQPDRLFFVSRSSLDVCRPALEDVVPERAWRVLRNGLDLGSILTRRRPTCRSPQPVRHRRRAGHRRRVRASPTQTTRAPLPGHGAG